MLVVIHLLSDAWIYYHVHCVVWIGLMLVIIHLLSVASIYYHVHCVVWIGLLLVHTLVISCVDILPCAFLFFGLGCC